jgi:Nucleoside transporter
MKIEGPDQREGKPAPSSKLRYLFFGTSAFAALYVFNCLLSLVDYWNDRYPKGTFDLSLLIGNIGGLVGLLSARQLSKTFTPGKLIMWGSPATFLGSALILLVGETVPVSIGWPKKALGAFGGFIVGAAGSITQTSITSYAFRFGAIEIAAMNSGIAVAGMVTVLIAMANIQFTSPSLTTQVISYEIFQLVGVLLIFSITKAYFNSAKSDHYLFSALKESDSSSYTDVQGSVGTFAQSNLHFKSKDEVSEAPPTIWSTFKIIYPYWLSIFVVYMITMSLVPGVVFGLGIGWDNPQSSQVILLIFNTVDLMGRYMFGIWVIESKSANLWMSLARILMVIFSAMVLMPSGMVEYMNNWSITLTITAITGLTTGYLNCSLFHLASEHTKGRHSVNSAFLMILGIMLGLAYGSLINVVGMN